MESAFFDEWMPLLLAAIRAQGLSAVDEVDAVVLETDGSVSVIGR